MCNRCRACARFFTPAYRCHLTGNKPQPEILLPNCCQFRVCNHAFSFALVRNLPRKNDFCLGTKSVCRPRPYHLATPPNQASRLDSLAFYRFRSVSRCQFSKTFRISPHLRARIANSPVQRNRAYKYYLDGYKVNGKRKRLFFKDIAAANRKLAELAKRQKKGGPGWPRYFSGAESHGGYHSSRRHAV
jgi:hypothetical protein